LDHFQLICIYLVFWNAEDLNTTVAKVSMTLSSYFIGISAGQLLYGPYLIVWKAIVYWLLVYILASGLCLCDDIDTFIGLRFIQAVGSCAATVAAIAWFRFVSVKEIPKYSLY
jgi:DHA1 family bicyclomycin/chloramphenicol resistance-like MFS transporter